RQSTGTNWSLSPKNRVSSYQLRETSMSIASPRSLAVWLSLIMASALPTADAAEAVFIRDGKPIDLFEQKGDWKQQDGGLQAAGTDARLIAGQGLGAGDFQVTVELTLLNLDRSAASLML